jgi:hypothetical protein
LCKAARPMENPPPPVKWLEAADAFQLMS